jgi:TonB family protein
MKSRCTLLLAAAVALLAGCGTGPLVPAPPAASVADAPRCGPQPYPFHALENHYGGEVGIDVEVAPAGSVTDAALMQPAGSSYLDAAALRSVRSCRFLPAAVARRLQLVVVYELVNGDEHLPRGTVTIALRPQAPR